MIRPFKYLGLWRADYHLNGRVITSIAHTPNEAWQSLIEIVAIEVKQGSAVRCCPSLRGLFNTL